MSKGCVEETKAGSRHLRGTFADELPGPEAPLPARHR
jgi:hypothetical protein